MREIADGKSQRPHPIFQVLRGNPQYGVTLNVVEVQATGTRVTHAAPRLLVTESARAWSYFLS